MRIARLAFLICTVLLLMGAPAIGVAQTTGYWQYVKTDSGIQPNVPGTAYPWTNSGVEGDFTVYVAAPRQSLPAYPALGATFFWSRPPTILIPGTALYWPVSAKIILNPNDPHSLNLYFSATFNPYQSKSDLATAVPSYPNFAGLIPYNGLPVGTVLSYNNALQKPPLPIPTSSAADSNGLMTLLTGIISGAFPGPAYLWNYVYQWVPGPIGSCGGTCTLASPGQDIGVTGGAGSVSVTATSTWNVVPVDSWIKVTSPTSGAGNSTVTFTVDPNTGGSRNGTLIIGGQPYTIYQAGAASTAPAETQIFTNFNQSACSQTGSSQFTLTNIANVTHWGVWYDWGTGETTVAATLKQGSTTVFSGNLTRAACDPYQSSWCQADAVANATWPAGAYTVTINPAHMCMNSGSSNQGFVYIYGSWQAGGSTGASTCAGTCSLGASGQPVAATSSTGTISVTATSSWTAVAVDTWIHITSGATGTGNGTVSFTADANTSGPRNGAISVAGQTYTIFQNGTPVGVTSGCGYLIQSNTSQSVPSTGTTSGLIQVITAQNCAWTATTSATWITLKSGTSSTGNGAVAYTVPQNDTANPRSGAIVIDGQNVAVNQAAGTVAPPPGTPVVSAGGVVNTASYAPGGPPNGSLAQGSFFSIYGSSVGPDAPVQASTYPLPMSLGGVTVQITQGSSTYSAYLVFVYKGQINAILPSDVPVGSAQITITYNGLTSQPATITVAKASFGVFFQQVNGVSLAIAQNVNSATDYPLNLPGNPAKPGQIVIFWGTGLGPISGVDNMAPGAIGDMTSVPVTITVGGKAAQRLYAGRQSQTAAVDNIYFTVPSGIAFGCQVPVVITAGGATANTTNIAITADGSPCQ